MNLILRSNFTRSTRWESPTFHHDENMARLYSGKFLKPFGLHYVAITHCITLHSILFKYGITQKERKMSKKMWRCI